MSIDTLRDRRAALMDGTLPPADASVDADDRAQLAWEFTAGGLGFVLFERAELEWELSDGRLHYEAGGGKIHYEVN